jgi:hypothetical protein
MIEKALMEDTKMEETKMEDTNTLTHLVQKPRSQSAGRPPLLLLLHGLGSN